MIMLEKVLRVSRIKIVETISHVPVCASWKLLLSAYFLFCFFCAHLYSYFMVATPPGNSLKVLVMFSSFSRPRSVLENCFSWLIW